MKWGLQKYPVTILTNATVTVVYYRGSMKKVGIMMNSSDQQNPENESTITVLVVKPGWVPEKRTIPNTLDAMQEIVDGYIEVYELDRVTVLVFNEEGKLRGLRPCIPIVGDVVVGDVIVCSRNDDGEFCSLSAAQLTIWEKLLSIPNIRDCGMLEKDILGG